MSGERAKRILVVEDDADARDALVGILVDEGHEVVAVRDGREALLRMRETRPDLVLLDLLMPVMNGWEFRAAQKQDPELAVTPVVAITALSSPEAAAVDADLCLRKPLTREAIVQMIRDVTVLEERRRAPAARAQMERMAALGTLAAGLAHEVNNPLTYVLLNLSRSRSLLARLASPDNRFALAEIDALLAAAHEGAERIHKVTQEVRTFARTDDIGRSPVNVAWVLDSALRLVGTELRHRARLDKSYQKVPPVLASDGRLGQVFLNLLTNAIQAIPEGRAREHEIRVRTGTDEDGHAIVEITDTGCGIPPHHLGRIFEPFYSTKPIGQATGLGLSICHGIVSALGGRIAVDSEVDKGTTVTVILPPARNAPRPRSRSAPAGATRARRLRVLIVDDEADLVGALRSALEPDHEVIVSTGGQAALDLLAADASFDVILCDLQMPDVTGADLYERVRGRHAALAERIVFMTGGAFTEGARDLLEAVPNPRLPKPLDLDKLRALIARY